MDSNLLPRIIELDICGQICPASLLVALREMNRNISQLKDGSVRLVVKTDNRDGTHTITEAASNMGLQVELRKDRHYYEILVGKN